jgi:hypothetical protein
VGFARTVVTLLLPLNVASSVFIVLDVEPGTTMFVGPLPVADRFEAPSRLP